MATAPIVCPFCRKVTTYRPPPSGSNVATVFCGCTSIRVDLLDLSARPVSTDLRARLDMLFGAGVGVIIAESGWRPQGPVELSRPVPVALHPDLLALAHTLLSIASDKFSNHTCNDFRLPDLAPEAQQQLADLMNECRVDDEKEVAADFAPGCIYQDDCLMSALAVGLRAMAGRAP